jgi:hypothetical protein
MGKFMLQRLKFRLQNDGRFKQVVTYSELVINSGLILIKVFFFSVEYLNLGRIGFKMSKSTKKGDRKFKEIRRELNRKQMAKKTENIVHEQ